MTITKVVIYNEDNREARETFGKVERIEITGRSFSYIVRETMDFKQLFNYLNAQGEWEEVEK